MDQFVKHDTDKPDLAILGTYHPDTLMDEARVLSFGAQKYDEHNWKLATIEEGIRRYSSAMLRHGFALVHGEFRDPETGRPHTSHIRCCAGFLDYFYRLKENIELATEPRC